MQFVDFFAAGGLVQAVDVLGDYGQEFSGRFQLGKLVVGRVWLYALNYQFFAVKTVEFLGIRVKKRAADDGFGRILPFLAVKAVLASKVGDSAFGLNSRSAKKDNFAGIVYN